MYSPKQKEFKVVSCRMGARTGNNLLNSVKILWDAVPYLSTIVVIEAAVLLSPLR
jgi:hypothetical protein